MAQNIVKHIKKGARLGVGGSLNVSQQNNDGQTTTFTSVRVSRIHFLGTVDSSNEQSVSNVAEQNLQNVETQPISPKDFEFDLIENISSRDDLIL